jgi:hypothetical protein
MASGTRWQTANQNGVAAIGTPGGSSMKTCGSGRVLEEQVDEEMTLRPPCSTGEAYDSHSRWWRPTDRDLTIAAGFGDLSGTTGSRG